MKTDRSGFLTHRAVLVVLAVVCSVTMYLVGNSILNASRVQPKQPTEIVSPEPASLDEAIVPEQTVVAVPDESALTLEDIVRQNNGANSLSKTDEVVSEAQIMALKFEVKPVSPQSWWPAHSHAINDFMIPQE